MKLTFTAPKRFVILGEVYQAEILSGPAYDAKAPTAA
jgi:hypothetical protein